MNGFDAWNNFYSTGKIEDYLAYKNATELRNEVEANVAGDHRRIDNKRTKSRRERPLGDDSYTG